MELTVLEPRPEMQAVIEKYDHPLMPVLRACAEGKTVINARDTIVRAGLKDGLPRLAFGHDQVCHYHQNKYGGCEWGRIEWHTTGRYINPAAEIPWSAWGDLESSLRSMDIGMGMRESVTSECPPIPKDILAMKRAEDVFCWEVEQWLPGPNLGDPVLLRPIVGEYCEVVAQWDLTPLEKEMFAQVL